jgi:chemotaxis protein methyltransferase CheR
MTRVRVGSATRSPDRHVSPGGGSGRDASRALEPASLSPAEEAPRRIAEHEFRRFQTLIEREAGIHLGPDKEALLVGRLRRRLVALGLRSYSEYYRLVSGDDPAECVRMLDSISTNETSFFREPRQFAFLTERAFPRWIAEAANGSRPRRLRAWCAACSTGQEPYSLAMALLDHLAPAGWTLEVLASDLSTQVLNRAALGTYPIEDAKEIPLDYLRRFMLRGKRLQQGLMRTTPAVREVVTFRRINLNDAVYPVQGPFDLVLCRNALMYFDLSVRRRVVDRLLDLLAPGGYLFLGHAESLTGLSERGHSVGSAIYARQPNAR